MIKTVQEVEQALLARIPEHQLRPRLEPTARAAALLGDPQKLYRIIHVTGTNGKTSTTRMIERLLREHSLRTGRFTSPHLTRLNERIAIDGESISDEIMVEIWNDIEPILGLVDAELDAEGELPLTYFEALTLLAFAIFADAPIDVLALEVGMGGEWDSTNVADGDVAVFTPIDMDHADRLGNTVAEIAKTKAGIIKPGAIVVSAAQEPSALAELQSKAKSQADRFTSYGPDFEAFNVVPDGRGQRFSVRSLAGEYTDLFMPLYGEHQAQNAALAIAAVEAFLGNGERRILDDIVRVAFADVASPGRLQVLGRDPLTLVDGAHNPHGVRSLARALEANFGSPKAIGVIGVLADKNADEMLETLSKSFDHVVITAAKTERAVEHSELAIIAEKYWPGEVTVSGGVSLSMQVARDLARQNDFEAIVITGSLSVVGEALKTIQEENNED
ncbi:MAG: dihydrofolate synthase [Actinobacteria bacterium]|uniref:tetrahydrofolate synthase n=1 Tax=freshwater metagenome TaxID=449393 RepID=A0A6J6H2R4_9ZZZZ|nr:dihydrofolate synthase [Actinomycetota bacterium]